MNDSLYRLEYDAGFGIQTDYEFAPNAETALSMAREIAEDEHEAYQNQHGVTYDQFFYDAHFEMEHRDTIHVRNVYR